MSRWDTVWSHLKWVYERTDRACTVEAAKFYEDNEPMELAGITEKVRRAIDKREAADALA